MKNNLIDKYSKEIINAMVGKGKSKVIIVGAIKAELTEFAEELIGNNQPAYGFGLMTERDPADDTKAQNKLRNQQRQKAGIKNEK